MLEGKMELKKLSLIFSILLLPIIVSSIEQEVTVNVLADPSIFLGDEEGGNDLVDYDGHVFATLSNNEADICQINWENGFENIDPSVTSIQHQYLEIGMKTVLYKCKGLNQPASLFIEVNDTINVVNIKPLMTIYSPINNSIFNSKMVPFNITLIKTVDKLEYRNTNAKSPSFKRLCSNCSQYGFLSKKKKSLLEGQNELIFRASADNLTSEQNVSSLFVDSKDPNTKNTKPDNNKYGFGNFSVNYDEINLKKITLFYGEQTSEKTDCPSGKNQVCMFYVDLAAYDGQSIKYIFELEDIAGNTANSTKKGIKVDLTPPTFVTLNYTIEKHKINFFIEVSEDNLKVRYNDNGGDFKTLCLDADVDKPCKKKKTFKVGEHNVTIKLEDKAGHTAEEGINFIIV